MVSIPITLSPSWQPLSAAHWLRREPHHPLEAPRPNHSSMSFADVSLPLPEQPELYSRGFERCLPSAARTRRRASSPLEFCVGALPRKPAGRAASVLLSSALVRQAGLHSRDRPPRRKKHSQREILRPPPPPRQHT